MAKVWILEGNRLIEADMPDGLHGALQERATWLAAIIVIGAGALLAWLAYRYADGLSFLPAESGNWLGAAILCGAAAGLMRVRDRIVARLERRAWNTFQRSGRWAD